MTVKIINPAMDSDCMALKPCSETDSRFTAWAKGCGVITHQAETQRQVKELARSLEEAGLISSRAECYQKLQALDQLTNQAMWLVVHMTYARRVYLDGRPLTPTDLKEAPGGHTGGALNMVPAYAAYMAINSLTGIHRDWLMGQGRCVAAIDALQLLTATALPQRIKQYPLNDTGLSCFVQDFYDCRVQPDGKPNTLTGAVTSPQTAGAKISGGYPGFAALQCVHMPPAEKRLVAFLSDGDFAERGSRDCAASWWRAEDSGLVCPIMIANGAGADQYIGPTCRHDIDGFIEHLTHQGFSPFVLDGRDPAAFVCAIYFMELQLQQTARAIKNNQSRYPVSLPYGIAETVKGYGFPGAGTRAADDLPLGSLASCDDDALQFFHTGVHKLWQPESVWKQAARRLVQPSAPDLEVAVTINRQEPHWQHKASAPMAALDHYFVDLVEINPQLRVRVGHSNKLSAGCMTQALELLKRRVVTPQNGETEAINGKVITAPNEETIVSACLANQSGLNMVVSGDAYAAKMLPVLRQSLLFSRYQKEMDEPAPWLGLPVIATDHIWEGTHAGQQHQGSELAENLLAEMADMARVVFPPDANSAMVCLKACYGDLGVLWNIVATKSVLPAVFSAKQAEALVQDGAICVRGHCGAELQLVACGAYQLQQALKASDRLKQKGVAHSLIYLLEPGRFRVARDRYEAPVLAAPILLDTLFPAQVRQRVFLTHIRPEVFLGHVRTLDLGPDRTMALGYTNQTGMLDAQGMLFINHCTWADALAALATLVDRPATEWLSDQEWAAISGYGDPYHVMTEPR